jgi:acetolactate synthase I/II/III large subunit
MNNAELIVKMLEQAGVRWAFGVPSGPVLPLIEAMRRSSVQYVLTASETSAGFMAQTVGALTGVPGVCVSTLGPGATNLATGVGAAWLDRSPLIAITCNVETHMLKRRVQMRIDHHALFQPLTKASLPLREGDVAAPLARALALATSEPPGPVHLDLPEDVALAQAIEAPRASEPPLPLAAVDDAVFEEVRRLLGASRRPLVVGGLDLARARRPRRLLDLVEKQGAPFIATLHAKGFLPESHANYAGVLGRARRSDVQRFLAQADLILAIGYDPIEINYEEWAGDKPLVHIGYERAENGEGLRLAVNAGGDLDAALEALAALPPLPHAWTAAEMEDHRSTLAGTLRPATQGLGPHDVLDLLRERLPPDGILAYDVGAHTHQIATQWRTDQPHTCISTNGWSSMGYGMPAAYAARLVHPDRSVIAVVGDGCFAMTAGELTLAKRLNLKLPVIVLNDGWLSLLRIKQERRGFGLSGVHLGEMPPSPAHYFGVPCRPAHDAEELALALDWALALEGPSVIEAFIDGDPYLQTVYD